MSERSTRLMQIGRFSTTTRLSVKALRLYDEIGLLVPEHVDESSGYRYYGPSQAARAEAIRLLRAVDMPLEEIARVLNSRPEVRDELMAAHLTRLESQLATQQKMIAAFSELVDGGSPLMPYEVEEKEVADQAVASITSAVDSRTVATAVGSGFGTIVSALTSAGVSPAGAPFLIMHDVIDEETPGSIEMCIPIGDDFNADGGVESKHIRGGPVAVTTHRGAYGEIPPAYHAISSWMGANGREPAGPPREIYLNDPTEVATGDLLTEVDWPMRRVDET